MNNDYSKYFEALGAFNGLLGNYILVEKLPEPEVKTASGIVLTGANKADRHHINDNGAVPNFYKVLMVGRGYDDGEMEVEKGDVVLLPTLSVKLFKSFGLFRSYSPNTIGITQETEIQMIFKGDEEYQEFFNKLNAEVE